MLLPLHVMAATVEQRQRFLYYFYEGERLWQEEQYADAFMLFDFCHVLCPDDAITNRYLGHIYRGLQLTDEALTCYRRAWEKAPTECWKEYAVTLYNTEDASNQKKAIAVMEQTSQLLESETNLWEHLRDAYLGQQQLQKALKVQDNIDKIDGFDAYSAINRYRIYLMMNKPNKALDVIEQYLIEDPSNLQFQIYRMELYEAMHISAKKLEPIYQSILQLDPYNALVLNNYAYFLAIQKKDLKRAEKMSIQAVQADSQNYTYLDTYAWILYLSGQKELAKLYMRQAIKLYPEKTLPKELQQHYNIIHRK